MNQIKGAIFSGGPPLRSRSGVPEKIAPSDRFVIVDDDGVVCYRGKMPISLSGTEIWMKTQIPSGKTYRLMIPDLDTVAVMTLENEKIKIRYIGAENVR